MALLGMRSARPTLQPHTGQKPSNVNTGPAALVHYHLQSALFSRPFASSATPSPGFTRPEHSTVKRPREAEPPHGVREKLRRRDPLNPQACQPLAPPPTLPRFPGRQPRIIPPTSLIPAKTTALDNIRRVRVFSQVAALGTSTNKNQSLCDCC